MGEGGSGSPSKQQTSETRTTYEAWERLVYSVVYSTEGGWSVSYCARLGQRAKHTHYGGIGINKNTLPRNTGVH